jgi:hypothetical protein
MRFFLAICPAVLAATFLVSGAGRAAAPAPIVWDHRVLTDADQAVTITLTGLDSANEALTFSVATQPTKGTLGSVTGSGANGAKVTYTPAAGFKGLDAFTFRAKDATLSSQAATVVVLVGTAAETGTLSPNTPKYPLKTASRLYTEQQVEQARALCKSDPAAAAFLASLEDNAAYWVAKSDEELRELLPDWRVPRAFNDSVSGCPEHGKDIFKHGTYPWKLDRDHPFTITCPVGGEVYPSNDFAAYYKSNFTNHALLTGTYVDPGRGWLAPDGEKRWMVGYAVHWNWRNTWLPAINTLAQAYALTGDGVYARKAIAMLDRVAEIYPSMTHALQSRYGELQHGSYKGKIVNAIWETGILQDLAVAYDLVFPALVGTDALALPWRTAPDIRTNIEANLLEEGIDSVGTAEIRGNFGMHQNALVYSAVVRESANQGDLLEQLFSGTGGAQSDEGLDYAFHNFVRKDGIAYENGLGYSFLWVNSFADMARPLALAGRDLYDEEKFRAMLQSPLALIVLGGFSPSAGDSGSISAKVSLPSKATYKDAFRKLGTPEMAYAWVTAAEGNVVDYESFEDLFHPPMATEALQLSTTYASRAQSRFLDGYGISFVANRSDSLAASLFYGAWGSHYHYDRLGVELYGAGARLSPDLGYPDFMNNYVPGIYTWSTHTISHNTLLVDDQKQSANYSVPLYRIHHGKQLHVVDTLNGGATTYPQCDRYRRTLLLRETGPNEGYIMDVFRVRGGTKSYHLGFHAQEAVFSLQGAALPPPVTQGTLAGKDVELGEIYDDPVLGAPGYTGGFSGYMGSGFQHLFNWQKLTPSNTVIANWQLTEPAGASLRLHIPTADAQEIIAADAYVSPTQKIPTILKYLLLRRTPAADGDVFLTIWEPLSASPVIDHVEEISDPSFGKGADRVVGVRVFRTDGTVDTLLTAYMDHEQYSLGTTLSSDATTVLASESGGETVLVAAGGTNLHYGGDTIALPGTLHGTVDSVDYATRTLTVSGEGLSPEGLEGKSIRIYNGEHSAMYWIGEAESQGTGLTLRLDGSEVLTGRFKLLSVDAAAGELTTKTALLNPQTLAGTYVLDKNLQSPVILTSVTAESGGLRRLAVPKSTALSSYLAGDDAWLSDIGPGDTIQVEMLYDPTDVETETDGGVDAGADAAMDGSSGLPDASVPSSPEQGWNSGDDGCSCRTAGSGPERRWLPTLFALLAGTLALRRPRKSRRPGRTLVARAQTQ